MSTPTELPSTFMDYRKRDKDWITRIGTVFGETAAVVTEPSNIKEFKLKIRDLLRKRIKIWWNKAALENYLSKNIIPRGLRVQIFPTFDTEDLSFSSKWEDTLTKCSRTLIELLVGADRKQLETLEKEIDTLKDKIHLALSSEEVVVFDKALDEDLSKWEKNIQDLKSRKFQRDYKDFQSGKVYRWHHKQEKGNSRSRSSSFASSTSLDESCSGFLDRPGASGRTDPPFTPMSTKRKTRGAALREKCPRRI
ncbi:uncharacterized protein RB166_004398 [Leptodactylus fuscus]